MNETCCEIGHNYPLFSIGSVWFCDYVPTKERRWRPPGVATRLFRGSLRSHDADSAVMARK